MRTSGPNARPLPPIPGPGRAPLLAFTVDVEDWYQSSVDFDAPITERVVGNVDRVLAMLDPFGVKATFFVQGLVARRFPGLVQRLVREGHEVQSHGHTHRPLDRMSRDGLREELEVARKSIEDASGRAVTAFRAPDFSIVKSNLWALEVLADSGIRVDSSVFPIRMRRYGVEGWEPGPQKLRFPSGAELIEAPVATWSVVGTRVPVGGGGYFRLLPSSILLRGLQSCIRNGRPPVIYCHPYEFNGTELEEFRDRVGWRVRIHQGLGRRALAERMKRLLSALPFGRLDQVLANWGIA